MKAVDTWSGLGQPENLPIWGLGSSATATASGGRLNKKDGLTRYGDSHVKDKTS